MPAKQLIAAATLCLLSVASHASVAEKKATRAAEDAAAQAAKATQQTCGNAALSVTFNWPALAETAKNSEAFMAEKKVEMVHMINDMGARTAAALESLAKICEKDADYKEEIAKLTQVNVKPKADGGDFKTEFQLKDTTLEIANGFYMTRSASDFTERLKGLY